MLVGYEGNSTNYRLFDVETKEIKVSRNVSFNEERTMPKVKYNIVRILLEAGTDEPDENSHKNSKMAEADDERDPGPHNRTQRYDLRSRESIRQPERYEAHLIYIQVTQTYQEAMQSKEKEEWSKAIQEEMNALIINETWDVMLLPKSKIAIDSIQVFSLKLSNDKNYPCFKTRLCAKGYTEKKDVDYTDTFSSTVRYDSLRILLVLTAQRNYKMKQFDVKTAFFNGELQDEIYVLPPEGVRAEKDMVCKLKKAYGLKQPSRRWNDRSI